MSQIGELHEDTNLPFQEDEQVIGKWRVIGEYAVKEDFYSEIGEHGEFNYTACAYEIVTVDHTDYMIIEWKSGDYRWGGCDTDYYVFIRE